MKSSSKPKLKLELKLRKNSSKKDEKPKKPVVAPAKDRALSMMLRLQEACQQAHKLINELVITLDTSTPSDESTSQIFCTDTITLDDLLVELQRLGSAEYNTENVLFELTNAILREDVLKRITPEEREALFPTEHASPSDEEDDNIIREGEDD